jgi:hypothetical protein
MYPLARTNLVQTFLAARGFSEQDFNYRLALGCLKTLRKEIPVSGGDEQTKRYRSKVFALLKKACGSSQQTESGDCDGGVKKSLLQWC